MGNIQQSKSLSAPPPPPPPAGACHIYIYCHYFYNLTPQCIFPQGQTVWRINQNRQVDRGWPKKVTEVFPRLQGRVSAVYRKPDSTIVVFSGRDTSFMNMHNMQLNKDRLPRPLPWALWGIMHASCILCLIVSSFPLAVNLICPRSWFF